MRWIYVLVIVLLVSCSETNVKPYVYAHLSKTQHCVILHADKDCGRSEKIVYQTKDLIETAYRSERQWYFQYGNMSVPFNFCAKCFSESMVAVYSDSIFNYRHSLLKESESIQEIIDNLEKIKRDAEQTEEMFDIRWGDIKAE